MTAFFRALVQIVSGVVAELSDQNAYKRHLAAHGTEHSPDEWRRFQDEHWAAKSRRGQTGGSRYVIGLAVEDPRDLVIL